MSTTLVIGSMQVRVDPDVATAVLELGASTDPARRPLVTFPGVRDGEVVECTVLLTPHVPVAVVRDPAAEVRPPGSADAAAAIRAMAQEAAEAPAIFDPADFEEAGPSAPQGGDRGLPVLLPVRGGEPAEGQESPASGDDGDGRRVGVGGQQLLPH